MPSTPRHPVRTALSSVGPAVPAGLVWAHTGSFGQAIIALVLVSLVQLVAAALDNGFLWTVLLTWQSADVREDMIRAASLRVRNKGEESDADGS